MEDCSGCGAQGDPNSLVCRFCGRSSQALVSAADELRALEELSRASQKMISEQYSSGLFGAVSANVLNNLGTGSETRIAQFWQNAFIPRTLEGQCQAIIQMVSLIVVPEGMMASMTHAMNSGSSKAESIYFDRADAILTAMRIHHAGDAQAAPKIAALEGEVQKERNKARAARMKGWLLYGIIVGGSLVFLGVAGLLAAVLG